MIAWLGRHKFWIGFGLGLVMALLVACTAASAAEQPKPLRLIIECPTGQTISLVTLNAESIVVTAMVYLGRMEVAAFLDAIRAMNPVLVPEAEAFAAACFGRAA